MSRGVRQSLSGFRLPMKPCCWRTHRRGCVDRYTKHTHDPDRDVEDSDHVLKRCASDLIQRCEAAKDWHLILEYELPRRQRRPDAILPPRM